MKWSIFFSKIHKLGGGGHSKLKCLEKNQISEITPPPINCGKESSKFLKRCKQCIITLEVMIHVFRSIWLKMVKYGQIGP